MIKKGWLLKSLHFLISCSAMNGIIYSNTYWYAYYDQSTSVNVDIVTNQLLQNLVGGLEHVAYFSIKYGRIIPSDFHIFQRD